MSDQISAVGALVATGKAKLPAVLTSLLPARQPERHAPTDTPVAVTITPAIVSAVDALSLTVARDTPALTVTERRQLTQAELDLLSDERTALDTIEKYIKERKEAHRAMIFNHFDVKAETAGVVGEADQDDKGHWIIADEDHTSDGANRWVRQLSKGSVSLDADALKEQVGAFGDDFTHEDYLACTTAVRVLDEEKALLHLRKKTSIARAWQAAIKIGRPTASLYRR